MKKIFIAAAVAIAIFTVAGVAKAATVADFGPNTLSVGQHNMYVANMQATLNLPSCGGSNLSTDGAFGPMTKATVQAFQLAHLEVGDGPLAADGLVGMKTKGALAACSAGITTTTTTTTTSTVAGCMPGSVYSSTTGAACYQTAPAGCMPGAMFSSTTGQSCTATSTTTTTTTTTSGPLVGGAGSVQEYKLLSSPANLREVGEDESDVKVLGLSVEADDSSDLNVKSMKLVIAQGTATNDHFEDFANDVTVWYGSTKVASVDADEFNDDNTYTKTISFDHNAVVQAGEIGKFYVAMSGTSNIDTPDLGDTWTVDVTSIRWEDAQGAIISEDPSTAARTYSFESFSTANDVELKVTDNNSPEAQVVTASDTSTTDNQVLLKGKLKAVGSDINIKDVTVTVTPAGTGDASEIASQYVLMIDGDVVDALDSTDCTVIGDCDGTGTATAVTYVFDSVDFDLSEGDSVDFELRADIAEISGVVAEGDSLTADIDSDDINAEDQTGETLTSAELTGSISGETQSFYSSGIMVEVLEADTNITQNDLAAFDDQAQFVWKIKVSSIGDDDVYINADNADVVATSTAGDVDNLYTVQYSSGAVLTGLGGTIDDVSTADFVTADATAYSAAYNGENFFKIDESGDTFLITVTGTNQTNSKSVRAFLAGLEWTTDDITAATAQDASTATINTYTSQLPTDSETPWKIIN